MLSEAITRATSDTQFWSAEERGAFTQFIDRRAEVAVEGHGLGAISELRDRALVYLLAYSGARSAEVRHDPNDAHLILCF